MYDPNKPISALWSFEGMLPHLFPAIVAFLEVYFNVFGKIELTKDNIERRKFIKYMIMYVVGYIGWSCIHYQIAGMKLVTAGMEVKGYSYAIFQFNSGGQIGLSTGLGVVVTTIAIIMGRGLERLCFVNMNGDALSLNCCKRIDNGDDNGDVVGNGGDGMYAVDEQQIALTGVADAEENI